MLLTQAVHLFCDAILSLAYPQRCLLCGLSVESRALGVACEDCWASTRVFTGAEAVCWKCGTPAGGDPPSAIRVQVRCRRCDQQPFAAARACGVYEGALRETVLTLKRRPHLPHRLVSLLAAAGGRSPLNLSTRIIPVPLHPDRERARGFNQASVIGGALSEALRLPVDEVSLLRVGPSDKYRAGLDAKGREETVAGAFTVRHPLLIAGENVLLVDDVFTTGATVSSCAQALVAAGAQNVFVLTIARPAY